MRAWIYILIAAIMQTMWGIVLKILDFPKVWKMLKSGSILDQAFLSQIIPLLLYLLLGLFIAVVISRAYRLMSMSVVYASWMGISLALQVLVDVMYYAEKIRTIQLICITMILVGILGMKLFHKNQSIEEQ